MKIILLTQSCLLALITLKARCQQPVNCEWGTYGGWSECDGCSGTQVRTRAIDVFPQFGGRLCAGESHERQTCSPTNSCPLDQGCNGRFRCTSGQCIRAALVCNGDQDCEEDGLDEQQCPPSSTPVCNLHKTPPNSDLTGMGFDILTGKLTAGLINTRSFGGQCRKVFSGNHQDWYRLPQSVLSYNFQVAVNNDFSDEVYDSSWSYTEHVEQRNPIRGGHDHRTFHGQLRRDKAYHLLIIKNEVELAQFQNNAPEFLPLSDGFWKALSALPSTYDPAAYRSLLQRFGSHYMAEGSLGGEFQMLLEFDSQFISEMTQYDTDFHQCITRVKRRLFRKKTTTKCEKLIESIRKSSEHNDKKMFVKTNVIGGHSEYIASLGYLDLDNPEQNQATYTKWAGSVKDFPQVMKQKLRPIYELVKEVPCAELKKLHLKRALESYLEEQSPCHCRPCQNNGRPLLIDGVCSCECRPDTNGAACQNGHVPGEQSGVVHGSWTCWSAWGSCSGGQRSRTRSCTNPAPRNGGKHCLGFAVEQKSCEDQDLEHLRFMEPHCFPTVTTPVRSCGAPPALQNGFVLNPKDVNPVGSRIEFTCSEGFHLIGDRFAECTDRLNWKRGAAECKRFACDPPSLPTHIMASPLKRVYSVGDSVSLSCPSGMRYEGQREITCRSSLSWTPEPSGFKCKAVVQVKPELSCKPWEKPGKGQCVCKMPYECGESLEVCVSERPRNVKRRGICQIGAQQCLGRMVTLLQDEACDWPERKFTSCQDCKPWESCNGAQCKCKAPAECPDDPPHICVSVDNGVAELRTECEAGAWRCSGKQITVLSLGECPT